MIWGTNFIFMKWAAAWITPSQIVLLRILFGFAPIFVLATIRRSLRWPHLPYVHHFLMMALLATVVNYFALVYAPRFFVPKDISPLALTTYQIGIALILYGVYVLQTGKRLVPNKPE